jgi:hypothetical protein
MNKNHSKYRLSFIKPRGFLGLCIGIVGFFLFPAQAGLVGTTWNNAWYPQNGFKTPSAKLATCSENIDFFAQNFGPSDNFSFFTNVGYTNDYFYGRTNTLELNSLYLQWEDSARTEAVRLGRQFTVESPLPIYMDGLTAKALLWNSIEITGMGGMKAPARSSDNVVSYQPDSIEPVFGLQIGPHLPSGLNAKVEYYAKSYIDETLTQYSGFTLGQDFRNGSLVSSEFLYDLTHSRIERAGVYATIYLFHSLILNPEISADNRWSDSLFALDALLNKSNVRAGLFAQWKLAKKFELDIGYWMHNFNSLGISHEIQIDAIAGPLMLTAHTSSGYGGDASLFSGELCAVNKSLFKIKFHGEAGSISYSDISRPAILEWMASAIMEIYPADFFNSRIELQTLGNPYQQNDVRVLLLTTFSISRFFP